MAEHPSAALHRRAHEAAARNDLETLSSMIAEDAIWHSPGKSPVSGDFRGRDAIFEGFFGKMDELSGGTAGFVETHEYFGMDDRSVALFRWGATRNGKTADFGVCEVIRWRDGQIVEDWAYYEDQYGWDEFWS